MGILVSPDVSRIAFGCQARCKCQPVVGYALADHHKGVFGTHYRDQRDLLWLLQTLRLDAGTRSVALKLNLCDYRSGSSGATTSVEFVASIIGAFRELCPSLDRIVLLEHDSSGTRVGDLFALLGFETLASEMGCELFRPGDASWRSLQSVAGLAVELPSILWDVDIVVNIPKLKVHGKTAVTGALKNNFGLVRQRWKLPYHQALCQTIISVNAAMPPQLVLMDGLVTLAGRGPAFGVPMRSDLVLGSWDPLAIDVVASHILHVPPKLIGHLRMAKRAGLGHWSQPVQWQEPGISLASPRLDWPRFLAAAALRRG